MPILIFDTETTGIKPETARIVQLAAILLADDFEERGRMNVLVQQDLPIPSEATRIHGITTGRANGEGTTLAAALSEFCALVDLASETPHEGWIVAHNLAYDYKLYCYELARAGVKREKTGLLLPFCTMRALTERMRLPSRYPNSFKWPRLGEAFRFCFNRSFEGAHDALADVEATRDIYIHGCREGWWGAAHGGAQT